VAFLQARLLESLGAAAAVLARMEQPELAQKPSALALEIGRQLTALEPGNIEWLADYANALVFDIDVKSRLKAWDEAIADAQRAAPLYQQALEHTPDDVALRLTAMQLRMVWGSTYSKMNRNDLALEQADLGLKMFRSGDQGTELLVGGKLPLLAREWLFAVGFRPDVARQAQVETQSLLQQLSIRPDAPRSEIDLYTAYSDYMSGQCDAGDGVREKLAAAHNGRLASLQKARDLGCATKAVAPSGPRPR